MREPQMLGAWLEAARNKAGFFKIALYVVLAVLVVLNFFIIPHHPHFSVEATPEFWAVFALVSTVVMVVVLKKIIYPMVIVSAVATVLFLGGWQGPFLPGVWWFLVKIYCILCFIIWLRWTFPRVRFDQLLNISWKWLTPLALLDFALAVVVAGLGG